MNQQLRGTLILLLVISVMACSKKDSDELSSQQVSLLKNNIDSLSSILLSNTAIFQVRTDSVLQIIGNQNDSVLLSLRHSADSISFHLDSIQTQLKSIHLQNSNASAHSHFQQIRSQLSRLNGQHDSLYWKMNIIVVQLNYFNIQSLYSKIELLRKEVDSISNFKYDSSNKYSIFMKSMDSISFDLTNLKKQLCNCSSQLTAKNNNLFYIMSQINILQQLFDQVHAKFHEALEDFSSSHSLANNNITPSFFGYSFNSFLSSSTYYHRRV